MTMRLHAWASPRPGLGKALYASASLPSGVFASLLKREAKAKKERKEERKERRKKRKKKYHW